MPADYLTVDDIMKSMGVGKTKAYNVIKELNAERKKRGYIVAPGKVSKSYYEARYGVKVER